MKKILFIEDEMHLQKTFEDLFKEAGFELISAYDGEIGLKFAEEKSPDLILLDLILPRKDGFEILRELKDNPRLSHIPVIVLTNLEEINNVGKALSLGARTYLIKANYSLDEVLKKIKEALSV